MSPFQLAARKLQKLDPTLGALIKQVGRCTLEPSLKQSPYQALVEAVVYQQLTGKAAATILARVLRLYPRKRFPAPEDLLKTKDLALRGAGLSRAKTAALKDIASKTVEGVVPTTKTLGHLSDEEILRRLTSIRGVGPWTVEMLLIFKLGRPDVMPSSDYGVRKGFSYLFRDGELPHPKELLAHSEAWRPYRTTAAWYLWRAVDLHREKRGP